MRVLVVGAGAVGGFLAARLADGGDDVAVLVRPTQADRLRCDGLRIHEGSAAKTYWPRVQTAPELKPEFDFVVLAVKSDAIDGAIHDVAPAVDSSTAVVPFLNGLRHIEPLVARFGKAVLGGVLRVATAQEDDGTVRVLAPTFDVEIGELAGPSDPRDKVIASRFAAAGATVTVSTDILGAMWSKWVFIGSVGAVTSLMRATVGEIVAVDGGAAFARSVLDEAAATAAAAGYPMLPAARSATEQILTRPGATTTSSIA